MCLCLVGLLLGGCVGMEREPSWGARWPTGGDLGRAAATAVRSPETWGPLLGAAVLQIGDLDEDLSDWAADEQPLFGADAESTSDDLRSAAKAAWLLTALAAPSADVPDKAGGLLVGVATIGLEEAVTGGIKSAAGRERPDGSGDDSFSSGHAGAAAAATTMALHNLDYIDMPGWADVTVRIGLYGIAAGTGWARVEARKHYVSDVLAGYAVGHFVATFMEQAFMQSPAGPVDVTFEQLPGGGALTVTLPLGAGQ